MRNSLMVILAIAVLALQLYLMADGKPLIQQPQVFPWVSMDAPNASNPIPPKHADAKKK